MQTISAYLLNMDQTLLPNTANPQRAVTLEVLLNQTLSPLSSARLSPPSNPTNEVSSGQLQHSTDTGRTPGLVGRISLERTIRLARCTVICELPDSGEKRRRSQ